MVCLGCTGELPEAQDGSTTTQELSDDFSGDDSYTNPERELVYKEVSTTDTDGNTVVNETGSLSLEQFQRTARPYAHYGPDEDYIYEEGVISESLDNGTVVDTYKVYRRPNNYADHRDSVASANDGGVEVSPLIDLVTEDMSDSDTVDLIAHIKDFPTFYKPLMPPPEMMGPNTAQDLIVQREAVAQDRENTAYSMSQSFRDDIPVEGGEVLTVVDWGGAVVFSYPVDNIDDLKVRDDISYLEPADDPTDTDESCGEGDQDCYDNQPGVVAEDNFLGRVRSDVRIGVDSYWQDGHTGQQPNPAHHNHNQLVAGVSEAGFFEDRNPCYLSNSASCNNDRTIAQYACIHLQPSDVISCEEYSEWPTQQLQDKARHGTSVISILLGNYIDGQGAQNEIDDPHYADHGTHTDQWESDATGIAPDAGLVFVQSRIRAERARSYSKAYTELVRNGVDVINMSHAYASLYKCDPTWSGLQADALAVAFDEGIFLTSSAGNHDDGMEESDCSIRQPASVPRVFTVNSIDFADLNC